MRTIWTSVAGSAGDDAEAAREIQVSGGRTAIPAVLSSSGCKRLALRFQLDAGWYTARLVVREPAARVDLHLSVDNKLIGANTVFYSRDKKLGEVPHEYDFLITEKGGHTVCLELPREEHGSGLEIVSLELLDTERRTDEVGWETIGPRRLLLDIWGWQSPLTYARTRPVDVEYYRTKVIGESAKWGANLVHYWNWSGEETIYPLLEAIHHADMIYDEHWFPPRFPEDLPETSYRIEATFDRLRVWADAVANAADRGWQHAGDGWVPEEKGKGADGACSDSENMVTTNHTIWRRNPGAYTAVFTNRPNETMKGDSNTTEAYKGPSFIYAVSTHQGLGIDDKFSHRLFYGETGLRNDYNDLHLFLQAECRSIPHRGPYGGRIDPDFWLKEICDFFRPRALKPETVHETGIFWMIENEMGMPEELRDYIYAVSIDPIRSALCTRLTSTGMGGSIWNLGAITGAKGVHKEYVGAKPRDEHPASTSFIQNNFFRLYRYAYGDKGVLLFDRQGLAHFDSNSLAIRLSDSFLRTRVHREGGAIALDAAFPFTLTEADKAASIGFNGGTGTYQATVAFAGQTLCATILIKADEVEVGMFRAENARGDYSYPFFVHGEGRHEVTLTLCEGDSHTVTHVEIERTCYATRTLKKVGDWNDSHDELQHHVTKGIEGYEFGEFHYPICYFDLDRDPLSEFPAGLAYGFPQPLNLDLEVPGKSACMLVVGGKARLAAGSRVAIGLNPDAGWFKHPDFVPQDFVRFCGEYVIPGDGEWHRRMVPVNFYKSGKNRLQVTLSHNGREGHWFDALELIESPVTHVFAEYGGHKAVLEESFRCEDPCGALTENRRYTAVSDTPAFTIDIQRYCTVKPECVVETVFSSEHYDTLKTAGGAHEERADTEFSGGTLVLSDSRGARPSVIISVDDPGSVRALRWQAGGWLSLLSAPCGEEHIGLVVALAGAGESIPEEALRAITRGSEKAVSFESPERPVEVRYQDDLPFSVPRIVKVLNPADGPYLVEEQGEWRVRGGQPSHELAGVDYVKLYATPGRPARIQPYGFIEGVVKPGYGCQHVLTIRDVFADARRASATVTVTSITPALFAPRVQFSREVSDVRVNGKPWLYWDTDGLVMLPNRVGSYAVEIEGGGAAPTARLTRTGALVSETAWSEKESELSFTAELPAWVRKLPERQLYMALVSHSREYRVAAVLDGTVEYAGERGTVVSFKPGKVRVRLAPTP